MTQPSDPRPGEWRAIADGLDEYHAVNLLEALKLVPDTGDWHGSLRIACQMVLDERGTGMRPNRVAERTGPVAGQRNPA